MERLEGTGLAGAAWRTGVSAPHEPAPFELSQNFFTVLFYLCLQNKTPALGEGLILITGVNRREKVTSSPA
jgi:hypothetical protein